MIVYVVAGITREFERWYAKGGTRFETEPVKLLPGAATIRTMGPADRLILLPYWRDRADWREIYNVMIATGRRGDR